MQKIIEWLGDSRTALAVQAIAAIGGFLVTLLLLAVTAWYARLTHALSQTAAAQLHAALQPNLAFNFAPAVSSNLGTGEIRITNDGDHAVQIRRAFVEGIAECEIGNTVRFHYCEVDTSLDGVVLPAHAATAAIVNSERLLRDKRLLEPSAGLRQVRWLIYLSCSDLLGLTQHGFMFDSDEALFRYRSPLERARRPAPADYLNIAEVTYPEGVPHVGLPADTIIRFEMRRTAAHEIFEIDRSWLRRLSGRAARRKSERKVREQNRELVGLGRVRQMLRPGERTDAVSSVIPPSVEP